MVFPGKGPLVPLIMLGTFLSGFVPLAILAAVLLTIPSKLGPLIATDAVAKLLRHKFRIVNLFGIKWWLRLVALILTYILGVRPVVHFGHSTLEKRKNQSVQERLEALFAAQRLILISNHRTTLDWMFLWVLQSAAGNVESLKIVLKQSLKKVPLFGWAASSSAFVFVSRPNFIAAKAKDKEMEQPSSPSSHQSIVSAPVSSELDVNAITRSVKYFNQFPPYCVVMFPEGTDLSHSNLLKSQAFAKENNLPVWAHVLVPRRRGLTAFLQQMPIDANSRMLDVTIGYEDYVPGERPTELTVFGRSRPPRAVHFLIECVEIEHDPDKIKTYLIDTFARKEKWLETLYKEGPPPEGADIGNILPRWSEIATLLVLCILDGYVFYNYFFGMCLITALSFSLFLLVDVTELLLADLEDDKKKA